MLLAPICCIRLGPAPDSDLRGRCEKQVVDASSQLSRFQRDGFAGPVELFGRRECIALSNYLDSSDRFAPADWAKGRAVTDWLLYRIAANPRLLEWLSPILGDDIVLWGSSVVKRPAGTVHPWHVDIESSTSDGRFATLWVGLRNAQHNATLQLIAGSHLCSRTVQQAQAQKGLRRGEASATTVLEWARALNPAAELVEPRLKNGEAVLMDGRLWHASRNERTLGVRPALLLQFASADSAARMYNDSKLEWPFEFIDTLKPPTILVGGTATAGPNRIVRPPANSAGKALPMLSTCIRSLKLPLAPDPGKRWQPYPLFRGSTPMLDEMECHASVLSAGHSPHPPHAHDYEELLIILEGEAELLIADTPSYDGARVERVGTGDFAYYPAFQHHTIRNPGPNPISYLMFKWRIDGAAPAADGIGTRIFRPEHEALDRADGFATQSVFDGETRWLGRLHCHRTQLAPGAGYAPHVDAYDVAIVTRSGMIETLGQQVGAGSVIYYSAGEEHGMRNIGSEPAHYLVFEFHAGEIDVAERLRRRIGPLAKRMAARVTRALGIDPHRLLVAVRAIAHRGAKPS
jgi:mannose-6-phosphate isomerase-like protein (cupin superfamily)